MRVCSVSVWFGLVERMEKEEQGSQQPNIYRAARSIKKRENSLYNALRSIYEDSIFVGEISQLWPQLPLLANLRCGLWYSPSSAFHATCYFKSTDGHSNNCSFNTSRLNLHVALLAATRGGCMIVDSTRRGKRFPDSMSKTIPIWTCVLNRAISDFRSNSNYNNKASSSPHRESSKGGCDAHDDGNTRFVSSDWDCSLHLPLWVPETEKASIEKRLDEWTQKLKASGADIASLAACLKKPLRPLWISQRTVIWLNEVPDHDSWDFTPIILVSASQSTGTTQHRTTSEFSWNYIPGAGDDEESWARGLSPALFWNHVYDIIINSGPDECNQKVADIVEKSRVYRSYRGESAPQITVKPHKSSSSYCLSHDQQSDSTDSSNLQIDSESGEDIAISWLGSTNVAVSTSQIAADAADVDCILNCDRESISVSLPSAEAYLHLPIATSKFDRFSLLNNIPAAVSFAKSNLSQGKRLLVCCNNGEDISVCVCLAILMSLFDEKGTYDDGKSLNMTSQVTKWDMRRRLVYVCKFATNAQPSRGNLRQVFNFLIGGKCVQQPLDE